MVDQPGSLLDDDVGCHIVRVTTAAFKTGVEVRCETLSDEALAAVASAARRWRDYGNMAVELSPVIKRFGLPGVAILFTKASAPDPDVPPALRVPFEPIELDEAHPTLEPLCERAYSYGRSPIYRPTASKRHRLFIRIGIPAVLAMLGGIYLFLDLGKTGTLLTNLIVISFMALAVGAALAISSWRAGRWFVVPGGVVVRKTILGYFGPGPCLYAPRNSVLVVTRGWTAWNATICQGYRRITRVLTDVECTVLLAAWQSPHAPPSLDEIMVSR